MFKGMKLKTKLLTIGVFVSILPLLIVSVVVLKQNQQITALAKEESTNLAYTDLDHIAESVYNLCRTQHELIQKNVVNSLNVARDIVQRTGTVAFSDEKVSWDAVNQYTKSTSSVELPKMMVGDTWLGKNTEMTVTSPIVDNVMEMTGTTCTVFQKMNDTGDMLRVSTNVKKTDGKRAIGTYIPMTNPDGTSNPVVSAVMRGETFKGRAYVVNKWYVTAYEPIYDGQKNVIGMLYVGVPQESAETLRQAIMDIKVGETGYVYVLDSKGHYVISKGGKRDGENIWNAKDANGTLFIQEVCQKAVKLGPKDFAEQQYPWKNQGDKDARLKVVRIKYYEPWDWVIGAGSYIDEFYRAEQRIQEVSKAGNIVLAVVWISAALGSVSIWILMAGGIAKKLNRVVDRLTEGSQQVSNASTQVSSSSQALAQGATEQAAGLEETSSSLEEMASMTKQNADNAQQANSLSDEAKTAADSGTEAMGRMNNAIQEIQKSSDQTAQIIKVIDEIAFQTNLLALNAAVEAARAGEAGKGFAVVAEEVRNLAMRSAEAAKNTSDMINESVKNAQNGVGIAGEVGKALEEIAGSVGKTSSLISEIAAASQEQAQGIDQVNQAVTQMDKVTQQNAASAEESASASEELNAQATQMKVIVDELISIIDGTAQNQRSPQQQPSQQPSRHHGGLSQSDKAFHQIATGGQKKEKPVAIPLSDEESADEFKEFNS